MPWKQWAYLEKVSSADFQNYLQNQVVSTFTTAAQRTTQLPTPIDGQLSYLLSDRTLYVWQQSTTSWKVTTAPGFSAPVAVTFGGEPLTTSMVVIGENSNLGTPTFDFRLWVEVTLKYYHGTIGNEMTLRVGSSTGVTYFDVTPLREHTANFEVFASGQGTFDGTAGTVASVRLSAQSGTAGGGIRAGVAKCSIFPR